MLSLRKDIFILNRKPDGCLVYSPLRGKAFYMETNMEEILLRYIKGEDLSEQEWNSALGHYLVQLEKENVYVPKQKVFNPRGITFILSERCNLDCSYCFAKEYRDSVVLSKQKIETLVKHYINSVKRSEYVFTFIGGGEPTLTWSKLQYAIDTICKCVPKNVKLCIAIVTNATLLTEERLAYLLQIKNKIHISVSFDVLPDIQNSNRKYAKTGKNTFDVVHYTLGKLRELEIPFSIRSTITADNVHRQKEMVDFIDQHYCPKYIHFEPVTSIENTEEFYTTYVTEFIEAFKRAQKHHIKLRNSITHRWRRINTSFCNGELCVTPNGDIIFCHRLASKNKNTYLDFVYGNVTNEEMNIDIEKRISIVGRQKHEKCKECFAQWICAGGCLAEKQMPETIQRLHCDYVRRMIIALIELEMMLN